MFYNLTLKILEIDIYIFFFKHNSILRYMLQLLNNKLK